MLHSFDWTKVFDLEVFFNVTFNFVDQSPALPSSEYVIYIYSYYDHLKINARIRYTLGKPKVE